MATFKKTTKKTAGKRSKPSATGPQDAREGAERLSRSLSESAQQIWLAGVGAFGRAQAEGTKLFEGLVKEGLNLEKTARKFAGGQAEAVRDVVESKVGQARERAADTWERLEGVFEERVQRALVKLDVPGRDDLANLSQRVAGLTAELRRQGGKASKSAAPTPSAASKRPATRGANRPAEKTPAAKKASTKKTAAKPAAKKSVRRAGPAPKSSLAP